MIFTKLFLLLFVMKIDRLRATKTASLVIGSSAKLKAENFLIEFMTGLKKISFHKSHRHRLVVIGKRNDSLQSSRVLLESGIPYFISTGAEATVFPLHFGADSAVLFFIDGYSDSELNSTFDKLPNDYRCKSLLISVERNRTVESIAAILASASKMKLNNVLFAHYDGQVIEIYGRVLNASCREEATLLNTWVRKEGFRKEENILGNRRRFNERGCPMYVSTFAFSPTMMLREDENKSLHISGGIEGRLVKSIAEYLNIVTVVKVPPVEEQHWVTPNGTILGIIGDVSREVASFGIGQIRPAVERAKIVDFTTSYNQECILWTVPLWFKYNSDVVLAEFSPHTWIMVILSVSICCGLVHAIPYLNFGYRTSLNIFDVVAVTLNYAIPRYPSGLRFKLFFLLYLHYSRIICTAYSTSLSSILTTTTAEPVLVDERGILAANLCTAGSQGVRQMLSSQIPPNSSRAELVSPSRYIAITSPQVALARIANRQDIAYLDAQSAVNHAAKELSMAGEPIKFHSLPGCVTSYYSAIVTPKGSRLTDQFNNIIQRLREAGIYIHWLNLERMSKSDNEIEISLPNNHQLFLLESVFLLYSCCLVPAFLAFGAELIAFKLRLKWFES